MKKRMMIVLLCASLYPAMSYADIGFGVSPTGALTSMPPQSPVPLYPPDGSSGISVESTFTWHKLDHAASYHVQVSTRINFSTLVIDHSAIPDTVLTAINLQNNTLYYWRVCAENVAGSGDFSSTQTFITVVASPAVPVLVAPANGATGVMLTVELRWNGVSGASSYHVQVSTQPDFSALIYNQESLNSTWFMASGLLHQKLYYWRVRARNDGGYGMFSVHWSFTTVMSLPATPVLVAPVNNSTSVSINPELKWNGVAGATSYHVQVATDNNFSALIVEQSAIISTWYSVNGLIHEAVYYWRVSASNAGGEGAFSAAWQFTTGPTGVDEPNIELLPRDFNLSLGYPNPFNSETMLTFDIPYQSNISLYIMNSNGQRVRNLAQGIYAAGTYTQHWDGRDDQGSCVSSGIYIVHFRTDNKTFYQKMTMLR